MNLLWRSNFGSVNAATVLPISEQLLWTPPQPQIENN